MNNNPLLPLHSWQYFIVKKCHELCPFLQKNYVRLTRVLCYLKIIVGFRLLNSSLKPNYMLFFIRFITIGAIIWVEAMRGAIAWIIWFISRGGVQVRHCWMKWGLNLSWSWVWVCVQGKIWNNKHTLPFAENPEGLRLSREQKCMVVIYKSTSVSSVKRTGKSS